MSIEPKQNESLLVPPTWRHKSVRALLWFGILVSAILTLGHLIWIFSTPKGFWVVPHIRTISAPALPSQPTTFEKISIPVLPGVPAHQRRISPDDLHGVTPGQRLYVIDRMYIADNQPTVFRLTPFRIFLSYPALFLFVFIFGVFRLSRLTSHSTRTQPWVASVML